MARRPATPTREETTSSVTVEAATMVAMTSCGMAASSCNEVTPSVAKAKPRASSSELSPATRERENEKTISQKSAGSILTLGVEAFSLLLVLCSVKNDVRDNVLKSENVEWIEWNELIEHGTVTRIYKPKAKGMKVSIPFGDLSLAVPNDTIN